MTEKLPLKIRFKSFRQRLSRKDVVQDLVAFLIAAYIRLVYYTSRTWIDANDAATPYLSGEKNAIYAFWHGRLLMVPPFKPLNRPMHVLISQHNDGELITRALGFFGIDTVRGSTSRGGGKAALGVVRLFRNGGNITITPDGPRGPNRQVQVGIIHLARLCDCPIIPVALAGSRHKTLEKSWDKLQIALPFSRVVAHAGAPLFVEKEGDAAIEDARLRLERALDAATAQADRLVSGR